MLFNSPIFLFLFLPIVVFTFNFVGSRGHYRAAIAWLVSASLFFYGWWNPNYLILISVSLIFNYLLGSRIVTSRSKAAMILGVAVNLFFLGFFKYANFFVDNINVIDGVNYHLEKIILPLAISFFTFEQISYIIDSYRGHAPKYRFLDYCLFVIFFPQLIAGPIVHHHEMLPQFKNKKVFRFRLPQFLIGLTIFFIGLFKKVVIADTVAQYSTPVFDAAFTGLSPITFFAAWGGALAYTFQLYFDFSGYSDMAIGIARMCGILLPLNFHSPYKAVNIIDFWRRWHITLSRFLRDYLYIPLGGNRKGKSRRYLNIMITMLLGGLWHGAGWTYVIWGGLHGFYLLINGAWRNLRVAIGADPASSTLLGRGLSRLVTFMAVVVAWVFFRAESLNAAIEVLRGMAGLNGFVLPGRLLELMGRLGLGSLGTFLQSLGWQFMYDEFFNNPWEVVLLSLLLFWCWFAPNTQQVMARYNPSMDIFRGDINLPRWTFLQWRLHPRLAIFHALITVIAILGLNQVSEFLYFQF